MLFWSDMLPLIVFLHTRLIHKWMPYKCCVISYDLGSPDCGWLCLHFHDDFTVLLLYSILLCSSCFFIIHMALLYKLFICPIHHLNLEYCNEYQRYKYVVFYIIYSTWCVYCIYSIFCLLVHDCLTRCKSKSMKILYHT